MGVGGTIAVLPLIFQFIKKTRNSSMRKICVWALLLMLLACLAGAALSEEAVPVERETGAARLA